MSDGGGEEKRGDRGVHAKRGRRRLIWGVLEGAAIVEKEED